LFVKQSFKLDFQCFDLLGEPIPHWAKLILLKTQELEEDW